MTEKNELRTETFRAFKTTPTTKRAVERRRQELREQGWSVTLADVLNQILAEWVIRQAQDARRRNCDERL